jgi:hypothetical protein
MKAEKTISPKKDLWVFKNSFQNPIFKPVFTMQTIVPPQAHET